MTVSGYAGRGGREKIGMDCVVKWMCVKEDICWREINKEMSADRLEWKIKKYCAYITKWDEDKNMMIKRLPKEIYIRKAGRAI